MEFGVGAEIGGQGADIGVSSGVQHVRGLYIGEVAWAPIGAGGMGQGS